MKGMAVLTGTVCLLGAAANLRAVEQTDTAQKSFTLSRSSGRKLTVDNVWGSVHVTAAEGDRIDVSVKQRWHASSQADLERARREVKLDMTQEGDAVRLYVDGPFRDRHGSGHDLGYEPRFDFEIRVPREIALDLRTVLDGDVRVAGTSGDFIASNVNGDVALNDIAGSGRASTVNGPVRVSFRENPRSECTFKTINGEVAVALQPGLNADVKLKTMNGEAWTDFDYQVQPVMASASQEGARFVYRLGNGTNLRVGAGGTQLNIETLNGPIRITKRGK
jgi:hypothetical protein